MCLEEAPSWYSSFSDRITTSRFIFRHGCDPADPFLHLENDMSARLEGKIATPGAVPMRRTVLKAAASLAALGGLGTILTDPLEARAAPPGLLFPPTSQAPTPFPPPLPPAAPRA